MSIEVAIVMGSASDWDVMSNAQKMLDQFGVKAESRVLSAHRTPKELEDFIRECEDQNVKAFIAGADIKEFTNYSKKEGEELIGKNSW